jgi:LysM repeat protein
MRQSNYQIGLRLFTVCLSVLCVFGLLSFSIEQAQAQNSGTLHIIQPGETLGGIAAKYGVSYLQLARYNGISNPNLVRVGQRLRIPLSTSASTRPVAPSSQTTAPSSQNVTPAATPVSIPQTPAVPRQSCRGELSYSVRSGDSLYRIAASYGVTVGAIRTRNNLPSSLIVVGQRLIIPSNC